MDNFFLGKNGFFWFIGVVEDRNDPMKLGRMRVRVLGIHTDDKTQIKTEDLPWAFPMMPLTSASMNGIGETPLGVVEGSWVVGFFRDGDNCQEPIIMGTIGGVPQLKADKSKGFNDPQGNYPKPNFLKEQDTNRLARNEETENTIVQQKKDGQLKDKKIYALDDTRTWSEPDPAYNSKYPYNKVYESESGHVIEIDDTPKVGQDGKVNTVGHERIHVYHRKGTFIEMQPDGSKVTKVVGNNHEIIVKDNNVFIQGECAVYIQSDSSIVCNGNMKAEVGKNLDVQVKEGEATVEAQYVGVIANNVDICASDGDLSLTASSKVSIVGNEMVNVTSTKAVSVQAPQVSISGKGSTSLTTEGPLKINSTGPMEIVGNSVVDLHSKGVLNIAAQGLLNISSNALIDITSKTEVLVKAPSIRLAGIVS